MMKSSGPLPVAENTAPSWLANADTEAAYTPVQPHPPSTVETSNTSTPRYKGLFSGATLFLNIFFSFLVAATGALGIGNSKSINDTSVVFVGLYMILFAGILVAFEVAQFKAFSRLDQVLKLNVGFLYGPIGKSIYIVFMGFFSFGISSPRTLAITTGVLVFIWGAIQISLFFMIPDYFDKKEKIVPTI